MGATRIKEAAQSLEPQAAELPQVDAPTKTTMPIDLVPGQSEFEWVGFSFGEIIGAEYSDVQIPQGWKRVAVGDRKVDIYDDMNRLRAEVRPLTATLLPRYRITEASDQPGMVVWTVMDGETPLYRAGCADYDFAGQDELFNAATRWLRIRYNRSEDPTAYW